MKNIITITLLCISAIVRSADLYVEENGASGAYTTIGAAVAALSTGDRILVFPRSGNAAYDGFTYAGSGLTILSAVEGQRYRVNTDINIGALTGTVHISNMYCGTGCSINNTAACAAPTITRFTDCYFATVTFNYYAYDNHLLFLQHDTLISSPVRFGHGTITGSYIENSELYGDAYAFAGNYTAPQADTITIVGNFYNYTVNNPNPPIYLNTNTFYNFSNNYFRVYCNIYSWCYCQSNYYNYTTNGGSRFCNNTVVYLPSSTQYCYTYIWSTGTIETNNNALITSGNPSDYLLLSYGICKYNYTTSTAPTALYPAGGTNILGAALTYDVNTGAITSAQGIDDGDPDVSCTDIDLTRNDIGCYGGSFSKANFDNADNGSRVLMANTPRRVVKGNAFTIKGDGLDK